ncbi:MAG: SAM-dependent methyltransferase, partial [Myxococcales bacterium]
ARSSARFDAILLDAPCTGLGTLRRHPELRYKREAADIGRLAALQRELLENVTRYLKPGGTLVYAVCSTEPEEGSAQAAWLVSRGFSVLQPEVSDTPWHEVADGSGGIATFPHRHGTDGFYAVRLLHA